MKKKRVAGSPGNFQHTSSQALVAAKRHQKATQEDTKDNKVQIPDVGPKMNTIDS